MLPDIKFCTIFTYSQYRETEHSYFLAFFLWKGVHQFMVTRSYTLQFAVTDVLWAKREVLNVHVILLTSWNLVRGVLINRKKAEEEERLRKEAEAEAAAQIAELDRQLKVRQSLTLRGTPLFVLLIYFHYINCWLKILKVINNAFNLNKGIGK